MNLKGSCCVQTHDRVQSRVIVCGNKVVFRFLPPHLMVLVALFLVVIWFLFLHQFRRSASMQKFFAELLGDNTPENALMNFDHATQRLSDHLHDNDLDDRMRQRIETALGIESEEHGPK